MATYPTSTFLRNFYGYHLLYAGRYAEGVRELEANAKATPEEPNVWDSLGESQLMVGQPEKAVEYYGRALTVDPRFWSAHSGHAWALAMLGRYADAIAESPPDLSLKAFLLSRVGRYAEAATVIQSALQDAENRQSWWGVGSLHLLAAVFAKIGRAHV